MNKQQVILIHGGESWETDEDYLTFLRIVELSDPNERPTKKWNHSFEEDLGKKFQLIRPQMPCAWNAKYKEWKIWFNKHVRYINDDVILVGNSLGGTFLVKYLSENIFPKKIKSLHLLAAPFGDKSCIKRSSFTLNKILDGVEKQVSEIHLYHSKDDDVVDFGDFEAYTKVLTMAHKHTFEDVGHFQVEKIPELLNEIK